MYRSGQRVVTQAIQKYLGSSYDVVKTVYDNLTPLLGLQNLADNADKVVDVADNLDDVTSVADNLTDVSAVADNIVAITEVNAKVDDFNTKYLGSYASAPTVDGNGDPLVEGATYWDTTLNAMFVYTGSQWVKPTGTGIVDVDTFTGDGSTASFPLDVSPASKTNTSVFIDGVYQEKDTYSVSTNLITFNTAPNDEASIEVIVNEITNFITGTQTETHTLTSGQTVVSLTNSPAFASFHIQGEDVDSQRLDLGTDYTLDLLTNTITLTNSYPENTVLKMLYGYDDDISVELAPLNQAILDHVNATENAHPASAIQLDNGNDSQSVLQALSASTVSRITDAGVGFSNWPQGKGVTLGNEVIFGYNIGDGHGGSSLHAYATRTIDGTQWSAPELIAAPRDDGGTILEATAWGMINRGGVLYASVRFREGGDTGTLIQSIYKNDGSGWVFETDLTFQTAEGLTPILLHDGILTDDNRLAFGYHDFNGSLGVLMIDPDNSYSVENLVLLAASNNNIAGKVLQAEPSFLKNPINGNVLIVTRTQDVDNQKPLAWVTDGNFSGVIAGTVETNIHVDQNPISMVTSSDNQNVLFIYSDRYSDYSTASVERAGLYFGSISLTDAFSLNFSSLGRKKIINLSATDINIPATTGAQKAVRKGDQIYIAVSSRARDNNDGSDVFCVMLDFSDDPLIGINLDSLKATQVDSRAELRLNTHANYDPRIRMNGFSVINRNDDDSRVEIGTHIDVGTSIGFYTYDNGSTSPAIYINHYDDVWSGRNGVIDVNRDINQTRTGLNLHTGLGWRLRVGGTGGFAGSPLIYHNNTGDSDVVEFGTKAGTYTVTMWATPTNPLTIKSENTADRLTIILAADSVESSLEYRAKILMLDAMFAPLTANKSELFSTTLKEGAQAFCLDGRKSGEGVGAGTGVPVYYNNGVWRTYYDNTEVQV